jgi:ribonuclease BN (tRNA processing enzyme)
MKIKILGTRGEIDQSAPYHAKQSGILIDNKLLLDCGDKTFLAYKPRAILITHLHPDHAFFVRDGDESIAVPMYAPEKYKNIKIHVIKKAFTIHSYRITPIATIHSLKVKSQAYLIQHKNKKILYTGDMIWIEKRYHRLLHNLDAVITEASFFRKGGMVRRSKETGNIYGHTGVPNLVNLFKKFTNTIIFTHFGSWFYKDMQKARKKLRELAKENEVKIIVGYDGLEITI